MAKAASSRGQTFGLIKLKIAGAGDLERVEAVRRAAPERSSLPTPTRAGASTTSIG